MRDETITCDGCGRDLTKTGNSVDYRLRVSSEKIPGWGGTVTDMMLYPPVDRDFHFCGLRCLRDSSLVQPVPLPSAANIA